MNRTYFIVLIAIISWSSCTKKTVPISPTAISEKLALQILDNHNFDYEMYSSNAKIDIDAGNMSIGIKAIVRIKKGGPIWFVGKKFGFEVGRGLVSNDTIKIIDRFNKKYIKKPITELDQFGDISSIFPQIRYLLVGNLPIPNKKPSNITLGATTSTIEIKDDKIYQFEINNIDQKISKMSVLDQNDLLEITYLSYNDVDGVSVPKEYLIKAFKAGEKKLELDIKLSKTELNSTAKMPFKIPNNYQPYQL